MFRHWKIFIYLKCFKLPSYKLCSLLYKNKCFSKTYILGGSKTVIGSCIYILTSNAYIFKNLN